MKTIKKVIPVILIAIMLCTGCGNTSTQEPQELEKQEVVQEKPEEIVKDANYYSTHQDDIFKEVLYFDKFSSCVSYYDKETVYTRIYTTVKNKSSNIIIKDFEVISSLYDEYDDIVLRGTCGTSYLMPGESEIICSDVETASLSKIFSIQESGNNYREDFRIKSIDLEDLTSDNQYPKSSDFIIEHESINKNAIGGYDVIGDITCNYTGSKQFAANMLYITAVVYEGDKIKMIDTYPVECAPGQSTSFEIPNMTCPKHEGEFTSIEFYPSYLTL